MSYLKGKYFIKEKANLGVKSAVTALEIYEDIKTQSGEFIAAKFIRDVYNDYEERKSK